MGVLGSSCTNMRSSLRSIPPVVFFSTLQTDKHTHRRSQKPYPRRRLSLSWVTSINKAYLHEAEETHRPTSGGRWCHHDRQSPQCQRLKSFTTNGPRPQGNSRTLRPCGRFSRQSLTTEDHTYVPNSMQILATSTRTKWLPSPKWAPENPDTRSITPPVQ